MNNMKFIKLLGIICLFFTTGCFDSTTSPNEYENSGKYFACDKTTQGEIINDSKKTKKLYCNGNRWIELIYEDFEERIDSSTTNLTIIDSTPKMYECINGSIAINKELCSGNSIKHLSLDDTEYPYAGIPRIVIETENFRQINDRETKIPAKFQIWGKNFPESEILELTIKGRGNSSWFMPKKSFKLEFAQKQTILNMPKDRDWVLIANYADKTLMKNYLMYGLSANLNAFYTPKCKFVEVYINQEYQGVYILSETIKKGKERIDIEKDDFIIEFDEKVKKDDQKIKSEVLGKNFKIHEPHNLSQSLLDSIKNRIQNFEQMLQSIKTNDNLDNWINQEDAIIHYWIQVFSKNPDANFYTSVYFVWEKNKPLKMGPVWDFDLAMGGYSSEQIRSFQKWHIDNYWYKYLLTDSLYKKKTKDFWQKNKPLFKATIDSIDSIRDRLIYAQKNNFKKWDVLESTEFLYHPQSYKSYKESTDSLKSWLTKRIEWIDSNL